MQNNIVGQVVLSQARIAAVFFSWKKRQVHGRPGIWRKKAGPHWLSSGHRPTHCSRRAGVAEAWAAEWNHGPLSPFCRADNGGAARRRPPTRAAMRAPGGVRQRDKGLRWAARADADRGETDPPSRWDVPGPELSSIGIWEELKGWDRWI